jgi:conjugal transfer pilus assembly protein TraL
VNDSYHVPQYLDEPFKLLLWTLDEFLLLFGTPLLFMVFFNSLIVGLIVGFVLMLLLQKLKGKHGHHFVKHLMYWYLPSVVFRLKATSASYLRQLIG